MMSFPKPLFIPLLLIVSTLLSFGEVRIQSITIQYYKRNDFKRILEYFRGTEFTGNNLIFRSDETDRQGLYFHLGLSSKLSDVPPGAKIFLDVVSSESIEAKRYEFSFPTTTEGKKYLLVGLTGKDWPGKETKLVAWRMEIRSEKKKLLASKESYLWGHKE